LAAKAAKGGKEIIKRRGQQNEGKLGQERGEVWKKTRWPPGYGSALEGANTGKRVD